jgi:acetoin utilization deacetylase AcuC-like enzyme/nucleotide-binding universal stress UspA family protein
MKRIKKILCTVDFSKYSLGALHYAIGISQKLDATLYVYHSFHSARDPIYGTTEFERGSDLKKRTTKIRKKIDSLMAPRDVKWEAILSVGDPVVESVRICDELGIDLVVAASHGITRFKRVFLGTVVERLARNLKRPMIVVREPDKTAGYSLEKPFIGFNKIIAGCDLHEDTIAAIHLSASFAKFFQTSLHLIHVIESPVHEEVIDLTEAPYGEVQEKLLEEMRNRLAALLPDSIQSGVDIQPEILTGIPAEQIIGHARRLNADLIVLGVRNHPKFDKIVIGSSTESVLRKAPCAVLVVPPDSYEVPDQQVKNKTGIIKDKRYLDHETGVGHPESSERLAAVYSMLADSSMGEEYIFLEPQMAAVDDILTVHSRTYVDLVAGTEKEDYLLSPDTGTCRDSYQTALLAVGGLFQAISRVVSGELRNAFALIRPPGHHAEKNRAMGYCLFNNIALGARYAQRKLGLERILVVDWDVHHGNGTQHAFETDPSVLFFSVHQFPHFPGTGSFTEVGFGSGEGYTSNVPLPGGYGDGEFVSIFDKLLRPMALEFDPDLILVSAGFDIHPADPLGGMRVSEQGFAGITRILMEIAEDSCNGRLVLSLEGGYDPDMLAASVKAVLKELGGLTVSPVSELIYQADKKKINYAVQRMKNVHRRYWKCFA